MTGPTIKRRLEVTCGGCEHLWRISYQIQDFEGFDYRCKLVTDRSGNPRLLGTHYDNTPKWCPLLDAATRKEIESQ